MHLYEFHYAFCADCCQLTRHVRGCVPPLCSCCAGSSLTPSAVVVFERRASVLPVAVSVTPPLSPMGGTRRAPGAH